MKMKVKKGDSVKVRVGKDKGKIGTVLAVVQDGKKVLVEGINLVHKCKKPNPNVGERGGIVQESRPIDRSNVMVVDESQNASKIGIRTLEDGQRVRYFKSTGQLVEVEVKK